VIDRWIARNLVPVVAFVAATLVFGLVAGPRATRRSRDPHFVVQAQAWLDGRLDIERWPSGADDPAKVEEVKLKDGSVVKGRRINSRGVFRTFGGTEVAISQIAKRVRWIHYMSFPVIPSVVLLPFVLVDGGETNDVALTVIAAGLVAAFFLVLLRRLREEGLSTRTRGEEIWLAALLCFGTVFFFSAVQGRVWFTAHVLGVLFAILYAWASIGAARPLSAGLFLGLAFGTRTPMLFMFPLFVLEAWRVSKGDWRALLRRCVTFGIPVVVIGLALAWHNWARFGEPTEFGHSYLAVRQQAQIEQHGLFDAHYLVRNLVIAFALLPGFVSTPPWISISGHGLAIWVTTPALLLLVAWARDRHPLRLGLWITVLFVAAWSLTYQNSGWLQFGYRFSLDYMVFLVMLLALAKRPIRWLAGGLILASILVNLFGAITFDRAHRVYRSDDWSYQHPGPPFWVRH
jgi:hypothetical protein